MIDDDVKEIFWQVRQFLREIMVAILVLASKITILTFLEATYAFSESEL